MPKVKVVYQEPENYIPDEIQKKNKIGKYAEEGTVELCGGYKYDPITEEEFEKMKKAHQQGD